MRLFAFLVLSVVCDLSFAQSDRYEIDIQLEHCHSDSSNVHYYLVNHTGLEVDYLGVSVSRSVKTDQEWPWDKSAVFGRLRIKSGDTLKGYAGEYGLYDSGQIIVLRNAKKDNYRRTLDSGCMYSINLLNAVDSFVPYIGHKFILPVYYDLGQWELDTNGIQVLKSLLGFFTKYPKVAVEIGVHFDERCSPELSTCLSCSRAEAIKKYLIKLGVDKERLTAKGYQGFKPVMTHAKTEEQHQMNRRVVFTVISID